MLEASEKEEGVVAIYTYPLGYIKSRSRLDVNPVPTSQLADDITMIFYMYDPIDRRVYSTVFVTPVMDHWLIREMAQWIDLEKWIRRPIAPRARAPLRS